jgi:hypothetical protein
MGGLFIGIIFQKITTKLDFLMVNRAGLAPKRVQVPSLQPCSTIFFVKFMRANPIPAPQFQA